MQRKPIEGLTPDRGLSRINDRYGRQILLICAASMIIAFAALARLGA